eukprot:TRINITY_DN4066_c0_g2_i7.p1 TRINITY_DN4066_c0_g2~~TRINITY_DN4066_c0_g2_i7.p1  ORF type:complete len:175 (-),score=9.57 TRINITY_DN4066_c0_g2_i7:458-913(-)
MNSSSVNFSFIHSIVVKRRYTMKSILFQILLIACLLFGSCYGDWCPTPFDIDIPSYEPKHIKVYIAEDGANLREAATTDSGIEDTLNIEPPHSPKQVILLCWTEGQYVSSYGNDEWVKVCYNGQIGYMHDNLLDCDGQLCRSKYGKLKECP